MNYNKNNPPVKRTTFQQHKEEIEAKKRRDNEEIAQVYADFVAEFGEEEGNSNTQAKTRQVKTFLKSSYTNQQQSNNEYGNIQSKAYQPKMLKQINNNSKNPSILDSANSPEYEQNQRIQTGSKKRKNLDSFLEELKKEQQEREIRSKLHHHHITDIQHPHTSTNRQPKTFNDVPPLDSNSTNLFVGNISTQVNETQLMETFGKFGPIASVKIMWPRTSEEGQRRNNSGFVCFMKREHALEALSKLDGTDLFGLNLRIGWGKCVQLPGIPIYDPNQSKNQQQSQVSLPLDIVQPSEKKVLGQITVPTDSRQLEVIHKTIERVLNLGTSFERLLMDRNSNDPNFAFLTDHTNSTHIYYKWKLQSLQQGGTMNEWSIKPFKLVENGPEFLPPPLPIPEPPVEESSDLDSEGNELPGTSKGSLLLRKSKSFEKMLNELTLDRDSIGDIMVFLIDNCDAAEETATSICSLLISEKTDNNHKLALLYLISDTLYNISLEVSGSWKLRSKFETLLPTIFTHFHSIHRGIQSLGRLKAEAFRKRVMLVIPGWERMTFFPQPFLDHLANLFQYGENYEEILNSKQSSKQAEIGSKNTTNALESEEVDGVPLNDDSDNENINGSPSKDEEEEDIDGVAYNSDD